jgi:DNA-binding PadR family transcriptional regulator
MSSRKIPALGYALLGLLQQKPSSGYQLRKIFSATSMKTYSDSPGAIYPALRRLEANGLIRGKIEQGAGLRRRQIFRLTSKGLAELEAWIRSAVTRDDLVRGTQLIMLRVAFSESVVGPDGSLHLLHSIEAALKVHLQALGEEFNQIRELAPTSARLAFEGGIRGTECLLRWTQYAASTYKKGKRKEGGP